MDSVGLRNQCGVRASGVVAVRQPRPSSTSGAVDSNARGPSRSPATAIAACSPTAFAHRRAARMCATLRMQSHASCTLVYTASSVCARWRARSSDRSRLSEKARAHILTPARPYMRGSSIRPQARHRALRSKLFEHASSAHPPGHTHARNPARASPPTAAARAPAPPGQLQRA
jgi:hypothetical protein